MTVAETELEAGRPDQVAGFAAFRDAGHRVAPPRERPGLLPGLSARELDRRRRAAAAAAKTLAVLALVVGFQPYPRTYAWLLTGAFTIVLAMLVKLFVLTLRRAVREWEAGYTTLRDDQPPPFAPTSRRRVTGPAWSYGGLWVLDARTGATIAVPRVGQLPPGFYPSPHVDGQLQLWSGTGWSGLVRTSSPAAS